MANLLQTCAATCLCSPVVCATNSSGYSLKTSGCAYASGQIKTDDWMCALRMCATSCVLSPIVCATSCVVTNGSRLIGEGTNKRVKFHGSGDNYMEIGSYDDNGWGYLVNINNSNGIYICSNQGAINFDDSHLRSYNDGEVDIGVTGGRFRCGYFSDKITLPIINSTNCVCSPVVYATNYFCLPTGCGLFFGGSTTYVKGWNGADLYLRGGDDIYICSNWARFHGTSNNEYARIACNGSWVPSGFTVGGAATAPEALMVCGNARFVGSSGNSIYMGTTHGSVDINLSRAASQDFKIETYSGGWNTALRVVGINTFACGCIQSPIVCATTCVRGSLLTAQYNSTNSYRMELCWSKFLLGNNGGNELRAGHASTGGYFKFYTNNTADQPPTASLLLDESNPK